MRKRPGQVRDAIVTALQERGGSGSVQEITETVAEIAGPVSPSSVRSYLRLNTPELFLRSDRGQYRLTGLESDDPSPPTVPLVTGAGSAAQFEFGRTTLFLEECNAWMDRQPDQSIHAVVTDPPYGLVEYSDAEQSKLRAKRGGVWRVPPSFDGVKRSPLPRFTVRTAGELRDLEDFFIAWAKRLRRILVPGANVVVASNPLLSHRVSASLARAGLERRGEIVRLVMTMRGGDRPKAAHVEFDGVSVMPRSMWEPWLVFRNPIEGRVQDNLRRWKTGGFRRISATKPFGDVIESAPTRASERRLAPHPSLKPQAFMRELVRGVLPLGEGVVLDPFAGSASTLAAAEAVGYQALGVERDGEYFRMACDALPRLAALRTNKTDSSHSL